MSNLCPYDETPCPEKERKRAEFRAFVKHLAETKENRIFMTSESQACPKNPHDCIRYQRYLNIIENYKRNDRQH